jgi:sn-glycerol 3-phosphate transport system substrate-binding protein
MPGNDKENTMLRGLMLGAATAVALAAATPAYAQIELQWWHAMTGANNDVIVKLATEFNESQKEYKVVPSYKGAIRTP